MQSSKRRTWAPLKPDVAANLKSYAMNVLEDSYLQGDKVIGVCPFCGGGSGRETTFAVNLDNGAVACWRADNCGVKFRYNGWVKAMNPTMDGDEIKAYFEDGLSNPKMLHAYKKYIQDIYDRRRARTRPKLSADVFPDDLIPLEESEKLDEVMEWLELDRGYDYDSFRERHDLHIGEYDYGRVYFAVTTRKVSAYLKYSYKPGILPKTVNPPDQILSKALYGYDKLRRATPVLFIHEGVMDQARTDSWGFDSVANFGTALSSTQVALLMLLEGEYEEFCVVYDAGASSQAKKAARQIQSAMPGKTVSYTRFTGSDDPDDVTLEKYIEYFENRVIV